ncbi:hypothetical protein AB1Y20_002294 [Prymnesium parvum]|uniref:Protein C10 n=1 Tax=Prymnesium parvum TaxID=97485 RepID=A0AB34J848_PRYPA
MAAAPVTFKDLAEAKKAMLEVFEKLEADQEMIKTSIAEAGDDIQKKMMTVIPLLQKTLAGPLEAYGFPPGGPGIMQGVAAFQQAEKLEGGGVLVEGMGMLKSGMMGIFPPAEAIAAMKAKLA